MQEPPYCGTVFFDLYHLSGKEDDFQLFYINYQWIDLRK